MAGETSTRTGVNRRHVPATGGPEVNAAVWSHEYTTAQLELNDVLEIGYIPDGATLLGFFMYSDDLDSDVTPTLARKITVGSTDVATGLTYGQSAAGAFVAIEPITMDGATLVKLTNTAAAATAVAGTTVLVPLYTAQ